MELRVCSQYQGDNLASVTYDSISLRSDCSACANCYTIGRKTAQTATITQGFFYASLLQINLVTEFFDGLLIPL